MSLTMPVHLRFRNPDAVVWTRQDCARLEADGYLNYRYELVEGEIINKMGQKIPHRTAVSRLTGWLYRLFGADFVQSQAAIDVSPEDNPTSEPEPDITVLTVPLQQLLQEGKQNPSASEVRLIVEVADTTLHYDLRVKAGLYARAGIMEYWVVDLNDRCIHVHRHPEVGTYPDPVVYREAESIASLAAPDLEISVSDLLP